MPSLFSYSTAPQPIKPATKYRSKEAGINELSLSLMSDPRVIRGTTTTPSFSAARPTGGSRPNEIDNNNNDPHALLFNNKRSSSSKTDINQRGTYTFAFKKYSNDDLDLSLYLTERESKNNATRYPPKMVETQTDAFVPRPQTPDYVPRKTGIDTYTEVENPSELFDFDVEVAPMLDVITCKTMEQALFEVNSESELYELNETMIQFVAAADAELDWIKQKEAETRRQDRQKEEDLMKMGQRAEALLQTNLKVAGLQMMEQIMPGLMEDMTQDLYATGEWNNVLRMTAQAAVAELTEQYAMCADGVLAAEEVIDELLHSAQETFGSMPEYAPKPRSLKLTIILRKPEIEGMEGELGETEGGGPVEGGEEVPPAEETELVVEGLSEKEGETKEGGDAVETSAEEDIAGAPEEPVLEPGSTKIGPIMVYPSDDIRSVQNQLNKLLIEMGKDQTKIELYPYFVAALRGRDFPKDACLLNFDLPTTLNIVI